MRSFYQANSLLKPLKEYLAAQIHRAGNTVPKPKQERSHQDTLTEKQRDFQRQRDASIIQTAWRGKKIAQKIVQNPYVSYLSMVDRRDEHYLISSIMFGRHAAEFSKISKYRVENPYIHPSAFYHRDDELAGILLEKLMTQFGVDSNISKSNEYFPITVLNNTPIEELLRKYVPHVIPEPTIIRHKDHSIVLLAVPLNNPKRNLIKSVVRACGLIASPWEIAANIKDSSIPTAKDDIPIDPHLPKTKEELLKSKIMGKLNTISNDPKHSTHKLAMGIKKLVHELPDNLDNQAIQRIALILDLTNTFYEHNYPRYAFCVYTIIHEISLALLTQKDAHSLKKDRVDLLTVLDNAKNNYANSALKDESPSSKAGRFILAAVVNFFAAFTLGLAHYINYKLNDEILFFSRTSSESKLHSTHKNLYKDFSIEDYESEIQEDLEVRRRN